MTDNLSKEEILEQLRKAIDTRKCPVCGSALSVDPKSGSWLHCESCKWGSGGFRV